MEERADESLRLTFGQGCCVCCGASLEASADLSKRKTAMPGVMPVYGLYCTCTLYNLHKCTVWWQWRMRSYGLCSVMGYSALLNLALVFKIHQVLFLRILLKSEYKIF